MKIFLDTPCEALQHLYSKDTSILERRNYGHIYYLPSNSNWLSKWTPHCTNLQLVVLISSRSNGLITL